MMAILFFIAMLSVVQSECRPFKCDAECHCVLTRQVYNTTIVIKGLEFERKETLSLSVLSALEEL
jgi:hypothetical protein